MCAHTTASELCGVRDGEPRSVNATRRDRMTCCCVDMINNRRLFSLIKEQRHAIEKITGGRANFLNVMRSTIQRRDRPVDRNRCIEHPCCTNTTSSIPGSHIGTFRKRIVIHSDKVHDVIFCNIPQHKEFLQPLPLEKKQLTPL